MTNTMVRVDAVLSREALSAFPHLQSHRQRPHSTITGDIKDQEELQGLLNFLSSMGLTVVEVVTVQDDE
jgi:hypothetical protein